MNIEAVVVCAGAAAGVIVLALVLPRVRTRRRRPAPPAPQGTRTAGRVVEVRPQTHFDRDRNNIRVPVRVEYVDPRTGQQSSAVYTLDRYTANIPAVIARPVGVTGYGSRGSRHEGQRPGGTGVVDAQLAHEADSEGFHALLEPIDVDVFVSGAAAGSRVRIVFRP